MCRGDCCAVRVAKCICDVKLCSLSKYFFFQRFLHALFAEFVAFRSFFVCFFTHRVNTVEVKIYRFFLNKNLLNTHLWLNLSVKHEKYQKFDSKKSILCRWREFVSEKVHAFLTARCSSCSNKKLWFVDVDRRISTTRKKC